MPSSSLDASCSLHAKDESFTQQLDSHRGSFRTITEAPNCVQEDKASKLLDMNASKLSQSEVICYVGKTQLAQFTRQSRKAPLISRWEDELGSNTVVLETLLSSGDRIKQGAASSTM